MTGAERGGRPPDLRPRELALLEYLMRNAGRVVSVEPLTPPIAGRLNSRARSDLVVSEVTPGGPAYNAGIRSGDIIREANRKPVASESEWQHAVNNAGDRPVLLLVERGGNSRFVAVAPGRG